MFKGDKTRKWLTYILKVFIAGFVISPNFVFTENYRSCALIIIILQQILFEDYDVWGVILSISVHTTDLGQWNIKSNAQIAQYFILYAIHYYIIYMLLFRNFLRTMKFHNAESKNLNLHFSGFAGHSGLVGFVHYFSNALSIFYCFDVPVGTYNFIINDPILLIILKYHI
jgi:hypothetical protein